MNVLHWSSCRILLEGEPAENDGIPLGIVGRLYVTNDSPQAVKHAFQSFEPRSVSLLAVGLQQVANQRGPDALIGIIPGDSPHSYRMRELAQSCYDTKECLVSSTTWGDIVLAPRSPECAQEDSFVFLVFVTNTRSADICDLMRHQQKVLVVLDLDNTLVDAAAVAVAQKDWDVLDWQPCQVTTESGRDLPAQYALLTEHDPLAEAVYIMHWRLGKLCCTFKVRIRRGWQRLREFLVMERSRFEAFVCSKGKQEYVQLLWHMLDPVSELFPKTDWDWRLNSTFPDAVPRALDKTMLTALGCAHPLDETPHVQLACPVMCFDDSPNAYYEEYHSNVMYVEEYRPSDLLTSDTGSILRQAEKRLEEYWDANYGQPAFTAENEVANRNGAGGKEGPWNTVVDVVVQLMHDMLGQPMQYPEGLHQQAERFAALGAWLHDNYSVRGVFGSPACIVDVPDVLDISAEQAEQVKTISGGGEEAITDETALEPASPMPGVEAEHAGEAAAAAEGREIPCGQQELHSPDSSQAMAQRTPVEPVLVNGKRQYVTAESLLCALCSPGGACLPGCPACAELRAAAKHEDHDEEDGNHVREDEYMPLATEEPENAPDDAMSTPGWISSACSTPTSVHRGTMFTAAAARVNDSDWGAREEILGSKGELRGDSEDEEEREAASSEAFTSVEPSLQGMGRNVFHMKLARISGHAMLMIPSARSISGHLSVDNGSLSISTSPAKWELYPGGCSPPLSSSPR